MPGELPPSPARREEARRQGRVAHSPLLTGAAAVAGGALALVGMAGPAAQRLALLAKRAFSGELPLDAMVVLSTVSWIVLPVAGAALLAAAAAGVAQTQGLFAMGALARRERPSEDEPGLIGWALAAALVLFAVLSGRRALVGLPALGGLWPRAVLLLAAGGAADLLLRRARLERSLSMTRAERRAEQREEEGDPRLKAERRRRQRAMGAMRRSLVDDLQKAQVVLAAEGVALALKQEGGGVRVVLAGDRLQALRIVEVARRLGIPVRGDDRLASALAELKAGAWVPAQHLPRALALIPRR